MAVKAGHCQGNYGTVHTGKHTQLKTTTTTKPSKQKKTPKVSKPNKQPQEHNINIPVSSWVQPETQICGSSFDLKLQFQLNW